MFLAGEIDRRLENTFEVVATEWTWHEDTTVQEKRIVFIVRSRFRWQSTKKFQNVPETRPPIGRGESVAVVFTGTFWLTVHNTPPAFLLFSVFLYIVGLRFDGGGVGFGWSSPHWVEGNEKVFYLFISIYSIFKSIYSYIEFREHFGFFFAKK
jgi:hypothetical protein